jgi:exonuclease III
MWPGVVRLITWNVAGRSKRLPEQASALATRQPDIVALQEVTRRTAPLWDRACELMGLKHVSASSVDSGLSGGAGGRRTVVMIGSRVGVEEVQKPWQFLEPRVCSACLHVPPQARWRFTVFMFPTRRTGG